MRLKKIKEADKIIKESGYLVSNPENYKGKWNELFGNNNPIELEIGTGRGKYIIAKAKANKEINYIGLEKYDSPLVNATKMLKDEILDNLKLINIDATNLNDIFDYELSKIYLNFSDPWPKKRHAKRRLSSKTFLEIYDSLFLNDKVIEMKTDNILLFEYSLDSLKSYGYTLGEINNNHKSDFTTEYEDKFILMGISINYVKATKKSAKK